MVHNFEMATHIKTPFHTHKNQVLFSSTMLVKDQLYTPSTYSSYGTLYNQQHFRVFVWNSLCTSRVVTEVLGLVHCERPRSLRDSGVVILSIAPCTWIIVVTSILETQNKHSNTTFSNTRSGRNKTYQTKCRHHATQMSMQVFNLILFWFWYHII